jgi:hypothetical protein
MGGSCSSGRLHGNGIRRVKSSQTCGNDAVVAVGEGEQLAQSREQRRVVVLRRGRHTWPRTGSEARRTRRTRRITCSRQKRDGRVVVSRTK